MVLHILSLSWMVQIFYIECIPYIAKNNVNISKIVIEDLHFLGNEWALLPGLKIGSQFLSHISTSQRNYLISKAIRTYHICELIFLKECIF